MSALFVSRHSADPRLRARTGFSIPELIVAMIIMGVGILALATGSAGVIRQMRSGNQAALASLVAQSRLEVLRSKGCASNTSGTATTRGMKEKWVVGASLGRYATVADTVWYVPRQGVTSKLAINTVVPCK